MQRCDQVVEQGASEEVGDLVGWQAGDSFDEGDELAVALAHDLAGFWIVAGSGGLQPPDEPAAFVEKLGMGGGGAGLKGSLRESMCQAAIRILRATAALAELWLWERPATSR